MFRQTLDPAGSLTLSALLALIPLLAVLVLLGGLKWKAHWAGIAALVISIVIAVAGFGMPIGQTLDAGLFGMANSVLLVLWITFNAIWVYNLTVHSGHFEVLRRAFSSVSGDSRVQAIVIAFSFGALLEALAGGGSPVAICSVMLIALGVNPLKAAALTLVADTAPVAFGGLGNPITALGPISGLPVDQFGAMAGRQVCFLAAIVPFVLLFIADGRKGLREAWPAALVAGVSFGLTQFLVSSYLSYQLCDILAAIVSAGAVLLLVRVWQPATASVATGGGGGVATATGDDVRDSRADVIKAFSPYAIIVVVFSLAQIAPIKAALNAVVWKFGWPGLAIQNAAGKKVDTSYTLNFFGATGTLLLVSGLLSLLVLKIGIGDAVRIYGRTVKQFGWAILAILAVFALSYVMNLSGQITTLGSWLAGTGAFFAFLSPVVGWFGVTITGTDVGSNTLLGGSQFAAAHQLGASPILFGAANSSGGVMAKMISPQNLAIGTAAVGLVGKEGELFRRVFGWSVGLLLVLCVLVYLQSTPVLGWMVP
ncbi:L-lactate permease [Kutzneria sp. CA-103260]|uniref:L-lactate permease n=1 Tax=Kutzneria sp. CA-103260 TaxID=2802641 RepID=UPI001BA6CECA|nr:L-lactate permease [Kutzneria sp. CA-103260]QUQ69688.1 L-lactate permease [Kutzneria sp. CA-103260]